MFTLLWALIYKVEKVAPQQYYVGVEINIPKDAYIYSKKTTSIGLPTTVTLDNAVVETQTYLNPEQKKIENEMVLIHKRHLCILIKMKTHDTVLKGSIKYLVCGRACIPKNELIHIDLEKAEKFNHKDWLKKAQSYPKHHHALWWILVLAFVGGVLLNFMPCVLPLLSIKVLSFSTKYDSPFRAALSYTGGMIFTFLTLGLILSLFKASYGFQMQSPYFVFGLCLLFLGIALNLFDFIKLPFYSIDVPSIRSQYLESFVNGVLTTVVATPCTGPYMGMVLGYSLTQSVFYILCVFLFLGIGMACPILFLILFSKLVKYVPRYSEGMELMKKLAAFLSLLTVVWFLYVLSGLVAIEIVFLLMTILVVLSFSAFFQIGFVAMASVLGGFYLLYTQSNNNIPVIEVSDIDLKKNKKPKLLVFTAKWCLNCMTNKRLFYQYQAILKNKGIELMFIDVTRSFPPLFQKYKAPGVPFNVFIKENGEEVILPGNLTRADLEKLMVP